MNTCIYIHERIWFAVKGGGIGLSSLALAGRPPVGRTLVAPPGPSWAPLGPCGPGPCGPGRPLRAPLGHCGPPWALAGGPLRAGPLWARPLWGPHGIYIYMYMYIYRFIQNLGPGGMSLFSIVPDWTANHILSYIFTYIYMHIYMYRHSGSLVPIIHDIPL